MTTVVVAAVIEEDGRFLVARRLPGTHLAGLWEFPGGKVDRGEQHDAALKREIREELGAGVDVLDLMLHTSHQYPGKTVALYFYACRLIGRPLPLLGQEMRWVARADLLTLDFPAADAELLALLTSGAP